MRMFWCKDLTFTIRVLTDLCVCQGGKRGGGGRVNIFISDLTDLCVCPGGRGGGGGRGRVGGGRSGAHAERPQRGLR